MFRRLSDTLPKDPVFPADLEKLGYFINENDQIRMISHPTERYQYKINQRERINELYKEAHNTPVRAIILSRLHTLGLVTLRLPIGTPTSEPHIPILTSSNLPIAKRITVFFGERNQDLGVFAYRIIGGEEGVNAGSAVDFVRAVQLQNPDGGIVIANPGQLIWCRSQGRAMGRTEWENLPRESSVHGSFRFDEEEGRNLVRGNRDEAEHVGYVFEEVLKDAGAGGVKIDIIAAEWTGVAVLRYLSKHWSSWSQRINGMCLIAPLHGMGDLLPHDPTPATTTGSTTSFANFISTRCRGYVVSDKPRGTLVEGRGEYGCNVYASGEKLYVECIVVRAWRDMLAWLGELGRAEEGSEERWEMPDSDGESGDEGEGKEVGVVDEGWIPDGNEGMTESTD